MKYKKIRGHNRRQRDVSKWIDSESNLSISSLLIRKYQYSKVYVQPWDNLSLTKSEIPEPNRETKDKIIKGLETIYNNWRPKLEELNQPFYLKIWLNEPRISKSQVVCAINERIDHYNNLFQNADFDQSKSDYLKNVSSDFKWEAAIDEELIWESELLWPKEQYVDIQEYYSDRRLLKRLRKSNYRKESIKGPNSKPDTIYFIPKGKVWIGEK